MFSKPRRLKTITYPYFVRYVDATISLCRWRNRRNNEGIKLDTSLFTRCHFPLIFDDVDLLCNCTFSILETSKEEVNIWYRVSLLPYATDCINQPSISQNSRIGLYVPWTVDALFTHADIKKLVALERVPFLKHNKTNSVCILLSLSKKLLFKSETGAQI